jgi:hypothetical protein
VVLGRRFHAAKKWIDDAENFFSIHFDGVGGLFVLRVELGSDFEGAAFGREQREHLIAECAENGRGGR